MTEIRGARTLVVGATGVLGAAIVRALHQEGARVVGTGRDAARLEALAGAAESVLEIDLLDVDAGRAAVARAADGLDWSPLEVALTWVRDRPGVTAPIVGARTAAQLRGSLTVEGCALPAEIVTALDDGQVLVLVDDVERELDRKEHPCRGKGDVDLLAAREPMAIRTRPAVDEHVTPGHEALRERTRPDLGEVCEDRVQPPARVGVRNAKAVRCQRRRSSGRPPRTRGTGGRRRPR